MMSMRFEGKPPQIPPQNSESGKATLRFYRSPMLVPGTGDDPVTSCFSDTRSTN
jgi:hypothetical protein